MISRSQITSDLIANGAKKPSFSHGIKALFLNPSFAAIFYYRLYSKLFQRGKWLRLLGRFIWRHTYKSCGCDISMQADLGQSVRIVHPIGIVIGEGVRIGDRVKIYQNVTIGRKAEEENSVPVIENDVTIGAGACVIGGITIGTGAVIGANAVVLKDVPAHAVAVGNPARLVSVQ